MGVILSLFKRNSDCSLPGASNTAVPMATIKEEFQSPSRGPPGTRADLTLRASSHVFADPVDGITSLLSKTHIQNSAQLDLFASTSRASQFVQNSIAQPDQLKLPTQAESLVQSVLQTQLENGRNNMILKAEHECFASAKILRSHWNIGAEAFRNFIGLACGNLKFPIILLQNPANLHDEPSLVEMIKTSPTLSWLEVQLEYIGLKMTDVIILDVCPLLSANDLSQMDEGLKVEAIEEAYRVTEDILAQLKPDIVISCQCATRGPPDWSTDSNSWPRAFNDVARELASSVKGAHYGKTKIVKVKDHEINVIQGFHPMHVLRLKKGSAVFNNNERVLTSLLQLAYNPCATWQREQELLTSIELTHATLRSTVKCFHENMESIHIAMENMIDPLNISEGSLPKLGSLVDCLKAFYRSHGIYREKMKGLNADQRSKVAHQVRPLA